MAILCRFKWFNGCIMYPHNIIIIPTNRITNYQLQNNLKLKNMILLICTMIHTVNCNKWV